jgi:hypothetical protein
MSCDNAVNPNTRQRDEIRTKNAAVAAFTSNTREKREGKIKKSNWIHEHRPLARSKTERICDSKIQI